MSQDWYERKTQLFYFAGFLNHSIPARSTRYLLATLARHYPSSIRIGDKMFHSIAVLNVPAPLSEYLDSIVSSIFSPYPEEYSPWSPRIYESLILGSIPIIIADGIVYPFERFLSWRSFSLKLNFSNLNNLFDFAMDKNISNCEAYVKNKKRNAEQYIHAFQWPFTDVGRESSSHVFVLEEDLKMNAFYYIYQELKCRRMEQFFGASSEVLSNVSMEARRKVCERYPKICSCNKRKPIAFDQYN